MERMRGLLAECLKEDSEGYIVSVLLSKFPTIPDLINAEEEELREIKGIGPAKARQFKAMIDFIKMVSTPDIKKRDIIHNPADVYRLVWQMGYLQKEHFVVIGLSTKNHVLFKEVVAMGTLNASLVHCRETFQLLIRRAANSCILVHNHPSGDPTPSSEDIEMTQKLVEAGNLLGISVLDHVIIGLAKYLSLKEQGMI